MDQPTLGAHDIVRKGRVTTLSAQHMGGLDGCLEEIATPFSRPLDDQPLGVIVDLIGEMGGREETIKVFGRGLGIGERLIDLFQVEGAT